MLGPLPSADRGHPPYCPLRSEAPPHSGHHLSTPKRYVLIACGGHTVFVSRSGAPNVHLCCSFILTRYNLSSRLSGSICVTGTDRGATKQMKDTKIYNAIYLHNLQGWLQDFKENLVDENCPSRPWGNPAFEDQDTSKYFQELPVKS